jgi:hypothetical protein
LDLRTSISNIAFYSFYAIMYHMSASLYEAQPQAPSPGEVNDDFENDFAPLSTTVHDHLSGEKDVKQLWFYGRIGHTQNIQTLGLEPCPQGVFTDNPEGMSAVLIGPTTLEALKPNVDSLSTTIYKPVVAESKWLTSEINPIEMVRTSEILISSDGIITLTSKPAKYTDLELSPPQAGDLVNSLSQTTPHNTDVVHKMFSTGAEADSLAVTTSSFNGVLESLGFRMRHIKDNIGSSDAPLPNELIQRLARFPELEKYARIELVTAGYIDNSEYNGVFSRGSFPLATGDLENWFHDLNHWLMRLRYGAALTDAQTDLGLAAQTSSPMYFDSLPDEYGDEDGNDRFPAGKLSGEEKQERIAILNDFLTGILRNIDSNDTNLTLSSLKEPDAAIFKSVAETIRQFRGTKDKSSTDGEDFFQSLLASARENEPRLQALAEAA